MMNVALQDLTPRFLPDKNAPLFLPVNLGVMPHDRALLLPASN